MTNEGNAASASRIDLSWIDPSFRAPSDNMFTGLNSPALRLARSLKGVKRSRFPGFIAPALATSASQAPAGRQWLHEVKFDGYRFQCHIHAGIRFLTRRGHDWSRRLPDLIAALAPLDAHAVILDGEMIVQTPTGRSDFHALEKALKGAARLPAPGVLRLRSALSRWA